MEGYYSVKTPCENTTVIERSKFICYLKQIEDESDAKGFIEEIRKSHPFATHNCYAYIADEKGLQQKFSDDGEPQGTAGQPILEVLKAKKLFRTVAVVTRYFGGIKLGAGGLVRAYSGAVSECVNSAKIVNFLKSKYFSVRLNYEEYAKFLNFFRQNFSNNVEITKTNFLDNVIVDFVVEQSLALNVYSKLIDVFCGQIEIKEVNCGFYPFEG